MNIISILFEFFICAILIICEILKSSWLFIIQFIKPQYKSLRDEIVLVTGAASGIGRLLCVNLASKGCIVVGVDINEEGLIETKDIVKNETNKNVYIYTCDIRFKENVIELRKYVEENIGCVDILINNAGIVHGKQILDLTVDEIKETFDVNTVQVFLPQMLKRSHGHIVLVSSAAGFITSPFVSDYCCSKASVILFGEALLTELRGIHRDFNIQVTTVTPFIVETGMFQGCKSRLPFLLPVLDPNYVSEKIVQGIMKNQIHLCIGRLMYFILAVRSILPVNALFELYKLSGAFSVLTTFVQTRSQLRKKNYENSIKKLKI